MCGRFALDAPSKELINRFTLNRKLIIEPRFNISPTQRVIIIRKGSRGYKLSSVRWGLIPSWAKDTSIGNELINARTDSLSQKSAFKDAFKHRRCLIPATGFYEWKSKSNKKQPYYIKMKNGGLFMMAGIWDFWQDQKGEVIESCAIITTDANSLIKKIHDRMPVILPDSSYGAWLTPTSTGHSFREYFRPLNSFKMKVYPVSSMVNNVKNEGPGCNKKIQW